MKKALLFVCMFLFAVLSFCPTGISMDFHTEGRISVNDKAIDIKGSAAHWEADNRLRIYFYPSQLSEKNRDRLDGGYQADFVALAKAATLPDPSNWKFSPYAMAEITFASPNQTKTKENVENVLLAFFGFLPNYYTANIGYDGPEAADFFNELEIGDMNKNAFVKLTTEGKDDAAGDQCVWELKSATEIFPIE